MTQQEMIDLMREDTALMNEAADEIARLRAENEMLRGMVRVQQTTIDILNDHVEALGGYND
jgi:hypothetical protein